MLSVKIRREHRSVEKGITEQGRDHRSNEGEIWEGEARGGEGSEERGDEAAIGDRILITIFSKSMSYNRDCTCA